MNPISPFYEGLLLIWFSDALLTPSKMRPTDHVSPALADGLHTTWNCGRLLRTAIQLDPDHNHDADACLAAFSSALLHADIQTFFPAAPGLAAPHRDFAEFFGACLAANKPIPPAVVSRLSPPRSGLPVQALSSFFNRRPL